MIIAELDDNIVLNMDEEEALHLIQKLANMLGNEFISQTKFSVTRRGKWDSPGLLVITIDRKVR